MTKYVLLTLLAITPACVSPVYMSNCDVSIDISAGDINANTDPTPEPAQ